MRYDFCCGGAMRRPCTVSPITAERRNFMRRPASPEIPLLACRPHELSASACVSTAYIYLYGPAVCSCIALVDRYLSGEDS
jgi:hypothetical protein